MHKLKIVALDSSHMSRVTADSRMPVIIYYSVHMLCWNAWQAVEFINNLKAERSGKKVDVELLEGELADDVRLIYVECIWVYCD